MVIIFFSESHDPNWAMKMTDQLLTLPTPILWHCVLFFHAKPYFSDDNVLTSDSDRRRAIDDPVVKKRRSQEAQASDWPVCEPNWPRKLTGEGDPFPAKAEN